MRRLFIAVQLFFLAIHTPYQVHGEGNASRETQSVIIEVDGDPVEHKQYLERYYPYVDVVAVYDKLFNGLALQATPRHLAKMNSLDFVVAIHPVQIYQTVPSFTKPASKTKSDIVDKDSVVPSGLNTTSYTGKGVKVGVIDTGIDYQHPDLAANYAGGYDLVDLDDDPMETKEEEGMATLHGTHVAGIIAANGDLKGVAPDAKLYAYRALGPGGVGSSVQVIAAMEQAVKDGMDVINLSLGNSINGPDYPTSIAVNRAAELGIAVVIANGNNGPERWTVGAPATATQALSVGALANKLKVPYLYEHKSNKAFSISPMVGAPPWNLKKDYAITSSTTAKSLRGKIALIKRGKTPFYKLAKEAEKNGAVAALIYNNQDGHFRGSVEHSEEKIGIPVAAISKQDGEKLLQYSKQTFPYIETKYKTKPSGVANFSSRGPVTVNWELKPDILAPGTNIISTVPGGYQELQGTSMAAPHVAGAIALMKEAHPNWSNEKIIAALKTTALPLQRGDKEIVEPIMQGMGEIKPDRAVSTPVIIYNQGLAFGKTSDYIERKTVEITIENTTDQPQRIEFDLPKIQPGLRWNIPASFILEKKEKKQIPIELTITTSLLKEGLHQGWLSMHQGDNTYRLPYLFINQTADYPKAMGLDFSLKPFSNDEYAYQLYLSEQVKYVQVELYNPDTLVHERTLLRVDEPVVGMNEGTLNKSDLGKPGLYKLLLTLQLADGTYENYEMTMQIDP